MPTFMHFMRTIQGLSACRKAGLTVVVQVTALFLLSSCQSSGCYENTEIKLRCTFYWDNQATAIAIDSLSVWGVGADSLVYSNERVSQLELSLDPNASSTRYVVQVMAGQVPVRDTLTFLHTNRLWFESMDCDCMVFSTLDTCLTTGRIFQSATLSHRTVNNNPTTIHVVLHL